MANRALVNGFIVLAAGLLASSVSSFLAHFPVFGTATDFTRGLCDGLSVIAFAVGMFMVIRSRRTMHE